MEVLELSLPGLKLIKPRIFKDERGFFLESYHEKRFFDKGIKIRFVQDNHSFSCKNTIRGLHFQKHPGQAKLVSVISGRILDVAVDIRPGKTFGKWISIHLDDQNLDSLFIPNGFAHGFCVLSEHAHVVYKVSEYFDEKEEKTIFYADKDLKIDWPIKDPIISKRDKTAKSFKEVML